MVTDKCADLIHRLANRIMVIQLASKRLEKAITDESRQHILELNGALDESMHHVRSLQLAIHEK